MNPLVTPEELAGYLQRRLERFPAELAVQGASGVVRAYCGWDLTRTVETLEVTGNGGCAINLPTLKLNDVTSVTVDGTALDAADFSWGANGILFRRSCWPLGPRRIVAEVDHGYDPIPDELRIVVCSIAGRIYSNPEGLVQKSSGDDSRSMPAPLSDVEMRLIARHRLT